VTSVGVVICAYTTERWNLLERAVDSVNAQGVDSTLVLVIDHHDELLARSVERWPEVMVIPNHNERGLSGARNSGVERLGTDVIAFLDDDACAETGWLEHLTAPFHDPTVGLTSGRVVPDWRHGAPAWFPDEFLWVVGSSYVGLPTEESDVRNPIGASMAVRRSVFGDVGLFSSDIGRIGTIPLGCEETELAIRAGAAGHRTRYVPDSVVRHHVTADRHQPTYFVRRCRAEGMSKAVVAEMAGADAALSSERSYVTRTLPRGIARRARQVVTGPDRGVDGALGAIVAIVIGCGVTALSYATTLAGRRIRPAPVTLTARPPRLTGEAPGTRLADSADRASTLS